MAQLEEICSERTSYSDWAEHVQSTAILNQQHVFLVLADVSVLALSSESCCNIQTLPRLDEGRKFNWKGQQ